MSLEDDKYYVGITGRKDFAIRIKEHVELKGAKWTKHHPIVSILEVHDLGYLLKNKQLTKSSYSYRTSLKPTALIVLGVGL